MCISPTANCDNSGSWNEKNPWKLKKLEKIRENSKKIEKNPWKLKKKSKKSVKSEKIEKKLVKSDEPVVGSPLWQGGRPCAEAEGGFFVAAKPADRR